ncbi:transmembrane protein [Metschnikowia bicuspidata var. bicuspidata NRRL YB-4993]|uniref:ER membrane protein complex subunit 3 n=1 Tax=Metschnikowia bicuspidata var. bicuspidata NRRL YB-4993 TaxID=869754 RepID=A0A1A0H6B4_9ASCO|nr:transmembrane protein [Metschnikowia bicuspidata var. bicuspidata NRRL YB-4993]OBA19447.1 transmembrane protein [Metschnikowia bicuspidata var. bicuspidata NRRL YB-4993]
MGTETLLLDPQLKWWMLLPISVAMVLVGILRSNITFLLTLKRKALPVKAAREQDFLKRAIAFKTNAGILTSSEFETRQQYLIKSLRSTDFWEKVEEPNKLANPLVDPTTNDALMNMAKGNIMSYVPQTLIMGWVNYFFVGSVVMKLPFPLTDGFKSMLQNGVNTPNLDPRYVSAISWYFVNLFGLRPIYSLLMADPKAARDIVAQQQQQQQVMPNLGGAGGPKVEKVFKAEAESIQILDHEYVLAGITQRILEKYDS